MLGGEDLSDIFGLDMAQSAEGDLTPAEKTVRRKRAKAPAAKMAQKKGAAKWSVSK